MPPHPGRGRATGPGSRAISEICASRANWNVAIIDPDAEILPQNRHFRAVTKEGATIQGTLLNEDKYSVQILDSNGRLVSLKRANLRESAIVEKSPDAVLIKTG